MKILKFNPHHLRNNRHYQFGTEFHELIMRTGADKLKIDAQLAVWLALFAQEDEAINKVVKSLLTEEMDTADRRRDDAIRGMVVANKAFQHHYWDVVRKSSRRLQILFDTYGNVADMPFDDETAAIVNLLQELKGAYAADVEQVSLETWITEIEAANGAFETLVRNRDNETTARTHLVLKQVRKQIDAAYRAITDRIDALMLVEGGEVYEKFIASLNTVIERYR